MTPNDVRKESIRKLCASAYMKFGHVLLSRINMEARIIFSKSSRTNILFLSQNNFSSHTFNKILPFADSCLTVFLNEF